MQRLLLPLGFGERSYGDFLLDFLRKKEGIHNTYCSSYEPGLLFER